MARGQVGTQGTQGTRARKARGHVGTQSTRARGHVGTQGTMARRAHRARDLADSFLEYFEIFLSVLGVLNFKIIKRYIFLGISW